MMKRIVLWMLSCFLCGVMNAQHQQIFDEYRESAGDYAQLFSGKIERGYSPSFYTNHPYWPSGEFVQGDVVYNGLLYREVMLRYDAFMNQLVVRSSKKMSNVCVPMHLVGKFTLEGTDYVPRNGVFMTVLFSGRNLELVESMHIVMKERMVDNVKIMYEFERCLKYYVLRDGIMHEVDKLKSVQKLFPDFKKNLKAFAKQRELDFEKRRRVSLQSIIGYVHELLSQP